MIWSLILELNFFFFNLKLFFFFFDADLFLKHFKKYFFLVLAALSLHCCMQALSSCGEQGLLCCGAQASHCSGFSCCRAQAIECRLSNCGTWAYVLQGMWNLPWLRIELMFPVLTGSFFTVGPLMDWNLVVRSRRKRERERGWYPLIYAESQ